MSRREALLARFRAGSLTRITDVVGKLDAPAPLSEQLLSELRAPLHTLKGEARMLGWPRSRRWSTRSRAG